MRMRPIATLAVYLPFAAAALAAEPASDRAEQLVGRWQSFSLASTNFDFFNRATNVTLFVHQVGWVTDSATKRREASIEAELRIRDVTGREKPVVDGPAYVSESTIVIGRESRVGFPYRLTNGVLIIEFHVPRDKTDFRAEFKKVSTEPGMR
jgi:hypothetical protein